MLKIAEDCFRQALNLESTKHAEPWIYRMMLGKIASKLGKPSTEMLQHFAKVSVCWNFTCTDSGICLGFIEVLVSFLSCVMEHTSYTVERDS